MKKLVFMIFALLLSTFHASADNYTVDAGGQMDIYCTASAPANGWITHAFFELADPEDAKYLAINYVSSDLKATVFGLSAKANIRVAVTYCYSVRGTYDNSIHVGHATYYEYITVKGGGTATKIQIIPSDPEIKVGETIQLKVQLTPTGSTTSWNWGVVETLTPPWRYEASTEGNIITIKGKQTGSIYIVAQTSNELTGTCVIKVTENGSDNTIAPTGIVINKVSNELSEGGTLQLSYTLSPSDAATSIVWSSSDESVATVSSTGLVTAVKGGSARINVSTSNGVSDYFDIRVLPTATGVSLPQNVTVTLGYNYNIAPTFTPIDARPVCTWNSSDTSVATVISGKVTGKKEGVSTIDVSANGGLSSSTQVNVVKPSESMGSMNTSIKLSAIKDMVYKTLTNQK